jgi:hypothetical protein
MLYIQKSVFQSISLFMAKKDVRYYLSGIHLKTDGSRFIIESSDGACLAFASGIAVDCQPFEVIIPAITVNSALKLKPKNKIELLGISSDNIGYRDSMLSYKSEDGRFPDIKRVWKMESVQESTGLKIDPTFYSRIGDCAKFQKSDFNVWYMQDRLVFSAGQVHGLIMAMRVTGKPSIPQYEAI